MKLQKSYFGNRFAAIMNKATATKAARKSSPVSTTEMEALESRILLSGVGTGLNKRTVTFIDADGDKVQVSISGRGATFDIDLGGATNNADIANIDINGNGSLSVVVTPVGSFTRPVFTDKLIYGSKTIFGPGFSEFIWQTTPGYTNIGSITADQVGAKAPVTSIGSIGLTAAVVADINLGTLSANNISLNIGRVAQVDALLHRNDGMNINIPDHVDALGRIDLYDITAGKINGINISGAVPALAHNDFLGDITVQTGIGRITGTNSAFIGQILIEGKAATLGNIVVNNWGEGGSISAAGDLTFNAAGFTGVADVDGHVNLSLRSDNNGNGDVFSGTIIADGGISGLRSSTTDAILITNTRVTGQFISAGAISDIVLTNGELDTATFKAATIGNLTIGAWSDVDDSTFEANTIGLITSYDDGLGSGSSFIANDIAGFVIRNGDLNNDNVISVANTLGLIDIANGNLNGSIDAGAITSIILRGNGAGNGNLNGDIGADSVGSIYIFDGNLNGNIGVGTLGTVEIFDGDLNGTVLSQTGGIGAIDITFGDLNGTVKSATSIASVLVDGGQISTDSSIIAATTIGSVAANWLDGTTTGNGIDDAAVIYAGTNIASVTGTSVNGTGIANAYITAGGTIGSVTGQSFWGGDGIGTADILAGTITSVTGLSTQAAWSGINGATIVSTVGPIGSIVGTGFQNGISETRVNAATALTSVSGTAINGAGIHNSLFLAGSVGTVVGKSSFGVGIDPVEITASTGNVLSVTGTGAAGGINGLAVTAAGSIGSVSGTSVGIGAFFPNGSGIENAKLVAGTSVGSITGVSFSADATNAGLENVFVSAETTIGAISGSGTGASGILRGQFVTQSGDILSVSGESTDANGAGSGIFGAKFISQKGFVSNISGYAAGLGSGIFDTTISAQTNVGDVTGSSLFGIGIGKSVIYAATGNIGDVLGHSLNAQGFGDGIVDTNITSDLGLIASVTGIAAGSGDGLDNVTVSAANAVGGSLEITGAANSGFGIRGGTVTLANGDLDITGSTVTGTAIGGGAKFVAALGKINITVNATGAGASGIDGATFLGLTIGDVTVNLPSSQADDAIVDSVFLATGGDIGKITINNASTVGGDGIVNSNFTAVGGQIGAISVTLPNPGAGVGIQDSQFTATGDIVSVTVTGTGDGILGNVATQATVFQADSDGNGLGSINGITVNVSGPNSSAILGKNFGDVAFSGAALGPIEAKSTNSKAAWGISNAIFTATVGNIGTINALTNGTAGFDAIDNSIFTAEGSIGNITALAKSGMAIDTSSFIATTGSIGKIDAEGGAGGIIALIVAKTSIGTIDADVTTAGGGSAIAANITAGTTIGAITVNSIATGADTVSGTILAGTGIGAITINSAANAGFQALDAFIDADTANSWTLQAAKAADYGQLGNITVISTGTGDGITGNIFAAEVGNISVTMNSVNAGDGIDGLTVIAGTFTETVLGSNNFNNFGKIGTISVVNQNTSGAGAGIINSTFVAGAAGSTFGGNAIGDVSVLIPNADIGAAAGIANVNFLATGTASLDTLFNSTIGTTTVTHTGGGTGVNNVDYVAQDGVGAITVTSQGNGLNDVNVIADVDADKIGNVGAVTVNITGSGSTGITDGSLSGFDVGAVTVNFNIATGGRGIAGLDVFAQNDIGNVTVGKIGAGFGLFAGLGDGITDSGTTDIVITAGRNIGDIYAQTADDAGTDSAIWLLSKTSAITAVGNIGTLTANNLADGSNAITGSGSGVGQIVAGGNLAGISINNASTFAYADGLDSIKLDVNGAIGPVSITVAGGAAMNASSIDPTGIGAINLVGAVGGLINGSNIVTQAVGDVASLTINGGTGPAIDVSSFLNFAGAITGGATITGNVDGGVVFGSLASGKTFSVAGNLAGITINTTLQGTIDASGTIGPVNVGGDITGATIKSGAGVVGNINADGAGNQSLTINSATVGNVVFDLLGNSSTVSLTLAGTTNLGRIDIENASALDTANLTLAGGGTLTSLGRVAVDGNWTLNDSLTSLASFGTAGVTDIVNTEGNVLGGKTIGVAGGFLTVGVASFEDFEINTTSQLPLNSVTFNINNVDWTNGSWVTESGATQLTAPAANGTYGPAGGFAGITVNLV